jgi:hypothetical protein
MTQPLPASLRAAADGLYPLEAATGLIIAHGTRLAREDSAPLHPPRHPDRRHRLGSRHQHAERRQASQPRRGTANAPLAR